MHLENFFQTFLLMNIRGDAWDLNKILLLSSLILLVKYYENVYDYILEFYYKKICKQCKIHLEMKVQSLNCRDSSSFIKSYKVLGILYKINQMKLNITQFEEIASNNTLFLKNDEDFENINNSHLIPKLKKFKILDDLFIDITIKSEKHTTKIKNKDDEDDSNKMLEYKIINVNIYSYFHNIDFIKKFVEEAELNYLKFLHKDNETLRIFTSKNSSRSDEDDGFASLKFKNYKFHTNKTFNNLFFEGKESIIKRIDNYLTNENKYINLGIPHTLGFLFYGIPGTGKTSSIKAIANYTNRSIISINMKHVYKLEDLVHLFNNSFINGFEIKPEKRIYVFEEIDCYDCFQSRDIVKKDDETKVNEIVEVLNTMNKKKKVEREKISLGQILELLDGIVESKDRICIFTTNHLEKIDKALLRPGRIDMIVEFKKLKKCDIFSLFKLWFDKEIPEKDLKNIKDYCITQADFGKLCFENLNNPRNVINNLIKY